jgi:sec-independent protein translocase protein TatA
MAPLFAWLSEPGLLIIGALAFLFFGNRLPSAMRSLGRGVSEFKKGLDGVDTDESADAAKKGIEASSRRIEDHPVAN